MKEHAQRSKWVSVRAGGLGAPRWGFLGFMGSPFKLKSDFIYPNIIQTLEGHYLSNI